MEIQQLFSLPTLFLSVGVAIITQLLKGWLEIKWPNLPANKNWNHAYLPTISVVAGIILSLFSGMVPQFLANGTVVDHLTQGAICGFFSSYVFRGINSFLNKELDIKPSNYPDVDSLPQDPRVPTFPEHKDNK
jgi:hypothetical protein